MTSTEAVSDSRRLFLSTITPVTLSLFCAWQEVDPLNQTEIVQDFRWYLSKRIREQLIIQRFVKTLENDMKSNTIRQLLQQKALSFFSHTQKL